MSTSKHSRSSRSARRRRPFGVSRRRKQLQLGFEALEDRRVMSAESPLPVGPVQNLYETVSYSSLTEEGQTYILLKELSRYGVDADQANEAVRQLRALPTDPLFENQWHLLNVGQQVGNPDFQDIFGVPGEDINWLDVHEQGIDGTGVVVAVIDSGVQTDHPDLAGNIDPNLQFDALTGDSNANPDAAAVFPDVAHGTAVAGLIGAPNNGTGVVGVAPGAQLVPIRLVDTFQSSLTNIEAFRFANDQIDITNNSWGPSDAIRSLDGPTPGEILALRDTIFFGRDGLGTIHVWAAGNGADGSLNLFDQFGLPAAYDSASYDGYVNSRYTIGVTGVDHDGEYNNVDGTVTSFPEIGPSVLVAAPTGSLALDLANDTGVGSGLTTTDLTNDEGFNQNPDPDNGADNDPRRDFLEDEAYTSRFDGTSGSAPIVSGVVALMLEANPNLSWRDVQDILVRSARQNAKFATQANGFDKAVGAEYQSTWIVNQVPLFHDPDIFDPLIPNASQILNPILDPFGGLVPVAGAGLSGLTAQYAPSPQVLTNGAGFTVSQGRGTNQDHIGYAHGVVDADLAVKLAQQWTTKGQQLPDELSFTTEVNIPFANNLPAAEVINEDGFDLIVPGGLGGAPGFGAYWDEYFADDPDFTQTFSARGVPLELTVPSPNDMVVEHIEVSLDLGGPATEAMNNLRIVLVSPNGTHSELNPYYVDASFAAEPDLHQASHPNLQANGLNAVSSPADFFEPPSVAGDFVFTFSTNRNWGERSDDALIIDPTTGEPIPTLANFGGNQFNVAEASNGDFLEQGWQIHFENYSTSSLSVQGLEVTWHGSPINANTQRVQGLIGIDDNRDDLFNYSRVLLNEINFLGDDPTVDRLGEVFNVIDPNHESMAENITVLAFHDANANGIIDATDQLVDQFVTGADGNYYFDLVPDDYIIALDDETLGTLTPLDDSLTPAGFLRDYQAQWEISEDFFKVWDFDSNREVPLDPATNAPFPLVDGAGNEVVYHVRDINFLLDPGAPSAPEVVFNGQVIADINGDGVFNGVDTVAPGILVYGDVNRNNQFDAGEEFTSTDINGNYSLVVPSTTIANMNVGVLPPVDWQLTNPTSGLLPFFTEPGDTFAGVDFALQPPSSGTGVVGSGQPGSILGFVFDDDNEDGVRQSSEAGIANLQVYIDNNDSGVNDAGDTVVTTNVNGAFIFTDVAVGTHKLRVDLSGNPTLQQTIPVFNLPNTVTITGENTISGVNFGLNNLANLDYGDLPDVYGTTFNGLIHNDLTGGARHTKGIFFLGSSVDAEINGVPSADALGDDVTGTNDEDGIFVDPLNAGVTGSLDAVASVPGGYLQGWVDFNGDGDFDDIIGGVSERIFTDLLLDVGTNTGLTFAVPDVIEADTVYARFRYGEFGLGLTGLAQIGEVEDYVLQKVAPAPAVHGPDFNEDGDVDGSDFLALQRGMGILSNALPGNGDANSDGAVGIDDFNMWMADYTGGTVAVAAVQSSEDESQEQPTAPLAAAIDTEFVAYYGTEDGEATTLGPRLYQPGFPEELPASVVDTNEPTLAPSRNDLASIAGRVATRAAYATTVAEELPTAENFADGNVNTVSEARDLVFESRQERIENLSTAAGSERDEAEALEVALDEEIDWLFG